jgi:hypothetical protein
MDLASIGYLYAMQTIKLGKKSVRVLLDMVVVILEDLSQEFMFGVMNSLDDVLVITREVEKAATLARGAQLGKDVLAR